MGAAPGKALTPEARRALEEAALRRAAEQEQITFIMSMHRMGLARQFGDAVLALKNGELVPGFIGNEILETLSIEPSL